MEKWFRFTRQKSIKEALDWMKKIYDEGLVRKDWATIDSGTFQEACKKEKQEYS